MAFMSPQAMKMVEHQLRRRGLSDERVLAAMVRVPRERFVRPEDADRAYDDCALPTAEGQTISQPYIVGLMSAMLQVTPGCRVLEVGTGSGYQTAILVELGATVVSIEQSELLALGARDRLAELGCLDRVKLVVADGTLGYPPEAPYDRVLVTAAAPHVPQALQDQTADAGRIVIPIGSLKDQHLYVYERHGNDWRDDRGIGCRFVPLCGQDGWPAA